MILSVPRRGCTPEPRVARLCGRTLGNLNESIAVYVPRVAHAKRVLTLGFGVQTLRGKYIRGFRSPLW